MRRISLMIAVVFLFVATAAACDNAKAAEHQAQMKALMTKVDTTWEQAQKATTPAAKEAALKLHGEALAELKTMHEKHLAMAAAEPKMDCKKMMEKKAASGEGCKMECCKDHKADAHAAHAAEAKK
jgi:hypothetical protein